LITRNNLLFSLSLPHSRSIGVVGTSAWRELGGTSVGGEVTSATAGEDAVRGLVTRAAATTVGRDVVGDDVRVTVLGDIIT